MADLNDGNSAMNDVCKQKSMASYFEELFRAALDDDNNSPAGTPITLSEEEIRSARSIEEIRSGQSSADEWLPERKKQKVIQGHNPINVIITPVWACARDDLGTTLRKEQEYVLDCVRSHHSYFGKTGRAALVRQLGVELGYNSADLLSIADLMKSEKIGVP